MSNLDPQMLAMLRQFKSNPLQFLLQKRLNIPPNVPLNDGNAILNYLISSGQISQLQINAAYQAAQQLGK